MNKKYSRGFLVEWRKRYQKINWYGRLINEDKKDKVSGTLKEDIAKMERKLQKMIDDLKQWMDLQGLNMPPAPWAYDAKDKTTWPSHSSFQYYDRMKFN